MKTQVLRLVDDSHRAAPQPLGDLVVGDGAADQIDPVPGRDCSFFLHERVGSHGDRGPVEKVSSVRLCVQQRAYFALQRVVLAACASKKGIARFHRLLNGGLQ